jgi:hypothetical protein
MENSNVGMDSLQRCPACHLAPSFEVTETPKFNITLKCEKHGYEAMGHTVESVKEHWNIFVNFMKKAA